MRKSKSQSNYPNMNLSEVSLSRQIIDLANNYGSQIVLPSYMMEVLGINFNVRQQHKWSKRTGIAWKCWSTLRHLQGLPGDFTYLLK